MEVEMYPWRRYGDMDEALGVAVPVLVSLGAAEPGGGYSAVEIVQAEQRLGRPLPGEVREFYRAVRPAVRSTADDRKQFRFYPLDAVGLTWRPMADTAAAAEPATEWKDANGLALGQSRFGDEFLWVEGHRAIPD